ncbi:hypothetical protein AB8878_06845 [Alphaproteobacteria bacterium LSUCC0226]
MRPYTKSHVRQIMSGLMKTKHHLLDTYIVELAASRWMMPVNERSIIQIELLHTEIRRCYPALLRVMAVAR